MKGLLEENSVNVANKGRPFIPLYNLWWRIPSGNRLYKCII
jgi:hypothetical protein